MGKQPQDIKTAEGILKIADYTGMPKMTVISILDEEY